MTEAQPSPRCPVEAIERMRQFVASDKWTETNSVYGCAGEEMANRLAADRRTVADWVIDTDLEKLREKPQ